MVTDDPGGHHRRLTLARCLLPRLPDQSRDRYSEDRPSPAGVGRKPCARAAFRQGGTASACACCSMLARRWTKRHCQPVTMLSIRCCASTSSSRDTPERDGPPGTSRQHFCCRPWGSPVFATSIRAVIAWAGRRSIAAVGSGIDLRIADPPPSAAPGAASPLQITRRSHWRGGIGSWVWRWSIRAWWRTIVDWRSIVRWPIGARWRTIVRSRTIVGRCSIVGGRPVRGRRWPIARW